VCVSTTTASPTTGGPTTTKSPGSGATPSPVQDGIDPDCKAYYQVASGDTCDKISKNFGISLSTFYALNPAVGTDCSALWLSYYAGSIPVH